MDRNGHDLVGALRVGGGAFGGQPKEFLYVHFFLDKIRTIYGIDLRKCELWSYHQSALKTEFAIGYDALFV